jgi:muramoyltetrapeptide carboxypeptidase
VRDPQVLDRGLAWLEQRGFQLRCSEHLRARRGYLAGDDDERMADFLKLVRAPDVHAILAARGGYGVSRFLHRLDPVELARARKLIIGYSDATALFLLLARQGGLASLHGPMLERDDLTAEARERLVQLACGDPAGQAPLTGESLAPGRATGRLVGGNLRMLAASLGTPWELETDGAVLFIEEIGEQPYALDRSLVQLRAAGKLAGLVGVAVGQLVNCESERYPEISACDVVREVLVPEVDGPVVGGLPFGHVADNCALGSGVRAELDGDAGTLTLMEPVVEVES